MLVSCWSAKGGSGTTVVSVALALLLARSSPSGAVLVDLAGDVPAVLGLPGGDRPGVLDWLAAGRSTPADALTRLEVPAGPNLVVVPRGAASGTTGAGLAGATLPVPPVAVSAPSTGAAGARSTSLPSDGVEPGPAGGSGGEAVDLPPGWWRPAWGDDGAGGEPPRRGGTPPGSARPFPAGGVERGDLLAGLLAADARPVVADCGTPVAGGADPAALTLAASASVSLLVLRPCFLALRRAAAAPLRPSGVVLVTEPGRALGRSDVEEVLGCPVRAEVAWDPTVARAVDAGLLAARLPRALARSLRGAA